MSTSVSTRTSRNQAGSSPGSSRQADDPLGGGLMAAGLWAAAGTSEGKWVFVGALALLLGWLVLMPRELIGQAQGAPPWWRNVRVWAVAVTALQLLVYLVWA